MNTGAEIQLYSHKLDKDVKANLNATDDGFKWNCEDQDIEGILNEITEFVRVGPEMGDPVTNIVNECSARLGAIVLNLPEPESYEGEERIY
jgi:hypothetical protein